MSLESRVLVVGTTPDYVHWIDRAWPGRAVFITDPTVRAAAREPTPNAATELLADLMDPKPVHRALTAHLRRHKIHLAGITSFDCESMLLAAILAEALSLPYPSQQTVALCRDKFRAKEIWRNVEVPCPTATVLCGNEEAKAFAERAEGVWVLKPLTGAGSELVFRCTGRSEIEAAAAAVFEGLARRRTHRLHVGFETRLMAENLVAGPEYSCDFLPEQDRTRIIRLARKLPRPSPPFGITRGYVLPTEPPDGVSPADLEALLDRAARSFGLRGVICMADFVVGPDGPSMLELAPRPGGDCLPQLIRHAAGLDMLGLALDVAEGRAVEWPDVAYWTPCAAVRIFAEAEGTLARIDTATAAADERVCEIAFRRAVGDPVCLPPADYDQWVLGHIVFRLLSCNDIDGQCDALLAGVRVDVTRNQT